MLKMVEVLEPWCKSVHERVHQVAVEDKAEIPGYKVVKKLGRTTWKSQTEAGYFLTEERGVDPKLVYNPANMRTPGQLKKELKGLVDTDTIDGLIQTPGRGYLVVKESDRRKRSPNRRPP